MNEKEKRKKGRERRGERGETRRKGGEKGKGRAKRKNDLGCVVVVVVDVVVCQKQKPPTNK